MPTPEKSAKKISEPVSRIVQQKEGMMELVAGEPCPTCGKPYGLTAAERQRRYRERKREI